MGAAAQTYAAACAMPACAAAFLGWLYLPHSPRLMYTKGNTRGAATALRFIAAENRVICPLDAGFHLCLTPARDLRVDGEAWSSCSRPDSAAPPLCCLWYGSRSHLPGMGSSCGCRLCLRRCAAAPATGARNSAAREWGVQVGLSMSIYAGAFIVSLAEFPGNIGAAMLVDR